MSNGGSRDLVRFEANERVDLPDLVALQDNGRSESRNSNHTLLTGQGDNFWTDLIALYGGADGKRFVLKPFAVSIAGTQITVTAGLALGGFNDASSTPEYGIWFGGDGDASQIVDVAAYADGTYYVRVKPVFDAAQAGTRVFWDGTGSTEVANSIDTRKVAGWTTTVTLSSTPDDGVSIVVASITIASGVITTALQWTFPLFEPGYIKNLLTSAVTIGAEWFKTEADSDPNLRDPAQAESNPLVSLIDWVGFVRGQIAMILADGGYWRQGLPETTTDHLGSIGDKVTLTKCRDHIDDTTDPHGEMNLTGTTTIATAAVTTANITTANVSTALNLTGSSTATFGSSATVDFENGFNLPNAGGAVSSPGDLPQFDATSDGTDAYYTTRWLPGTMFQQNGHSGDVEDIVRLDDSISMRDTTALVSTGRFVLNISQFWASSALVSGGPYLRSLTVLIGPPQDIGSYGGVAGLSASTNVLQYQLHQSSYTTYSSSSLTTAGITVGDCAWSSDTDVAQVAIDLSSLTTAERKVILTGQHHLVLNCYNQLDSSGNSEYCVRIKGVLVTYSERLLHP